MQLCARWLKTHSIPLCSRKTYEEILRLKVLDPAMGSGHFLVGAIDYLALQLATHPDAPLMSARVESAPDAGLVDDMDTEIAYWRRAVSWRTASTA